MRHKLSSWDTLERSGHHWTKKPYSSSAESSSTRESHPHVLTQPDVNLSIHTAPVSLSLETSWPQADANSNSAPPLVVHFLANSYTRQPDDFGKDL